MHARLRPLDQQTIVITGGSSGIGLATARAAVARGANIVIAARNQQALDTIAGSLRNASGEVATVAADVADPAAAEAIADVALRRFGGIDTWVNNAVAAVYGRLRDIPVADHRRVFEVGYWGTVYGSLAAVKLLEGRGGALINVGSVLSERAVILQGPYCAMKHAVRGFTDALRMELEADGLPVSVTLIKPSGMNTPFPQHARNYMAKPARIPPLVYDPQLVAKAILFAAEHPRRELTVGGAGLAIAKGGNLMRRLTDLAMEAQGEPLQQIDQPAPPERSDNLYEPREDGMVEIDHDIYVRRQSLWLEAQMRPALATALASSTTVLATLAVSAALRRRRRRQLYQRTPREAAE